MQIAVALSALSSLVCPARATQIVCINSDQGLLLISDKRECRSGIFSDNSQKIVLNGKSVIAVAGMPRIDIASRIDKTRIHRTRFDGIESLKKAMCSAPQDHSQAAVREIAKRVNADYSSKVLAIDLPQMHNNSVFTWIYASYDGKSDAILLTNVEVMVNHPSKVARKFSFRQTTIKIHRRDVFGALLGLRSGVFYKIPTLRASVGLVESLKLAYGELLVTHDFFKLKDSSMLSDTADVCIVPYSNEKPKWVARSYPYIEFLSKLKKQS